MKLLINRRHSIDIQFLKDCQVSIDIGSPYRIVFKDQNRPTSGARCLLSCLYYSQNILLLVLLKQLMQ